ncbi:MAG: KH domain-containing protein, partial [Patescibacteria group bacterium]
MREEETKIKEIIKALLEKIGVEGEIDARETTDSFQFTIKTNQAGLLIGEEGQNLIALNHILKRITEKQIGKTELPFSLDVNDYQK